MAQCVAVADALGAIPLLGKALEAGMLLFGRAIGAIITGIGQGDPLIIAAAVAGTVIGALLLFGLYQVSRLATSTLALTGFFILSLCMI